jgi:putative lipoprotein
VLSASLGVLLVAACQAPKPAQQPADRSATVTDKDWTLIELNGQPAGNGANGKPATLHLTSLDKVASGFAGCNRFMGTFTLTGEELHFSALALTRMACAEGMDLEQKFAAALTATRRYRTSEAGLELLDDSGTVARLESR